MRRKHGVIDGRRTRGAIVEWVEHAKSKRRAPIRLDKSGMVFWAVAGGEATSPYFESQDGGEVRDWLKKQLAKNTEADRLEWMPVIKIEVEDDAGRYRRRDDDEERDVGFSFKIDRFYLALTQDKREWRRLDWHECHPESSSAIAENDRYEQSHRHDRGPGHEDFKAGSEHRRWGGGGKPFKLPHREGNETQLPYTDELWEGLVAVMERVEASRKQLAKMVGTAGGLAEVARVGAERLPLKLTAKVEAP